MLMFRHSVLRTLLAAFVLSSGIGLAQVDRGTISGTASDPTGGVIPGAQISVENVNTGVTFNTTASAAGEYVAPNLIPGAYSVVATAPGFSSLVQTGIELHAGQRLVVNLALNIGEVTEQVEVTAEVPLLASESSTVSTLISRRDVAELPLNGRSVFQLAPLTAGVTSGIVTINANNIDIPDNARAKQGLSVNGQSQASNTYILDGVYNNQINQGLIAILPPLEAIQEFTVETSNFSAEIGRGGGVINVTLKSGTNQFHGNIFQFMRNSVLDARNFFDRTEGGRLPNFVQNQFGGSIGGPIVKNKTFFFADYQGFRQRQGQSFVTTIPSAPLRGGNFQGTARPIHDPGTYNSQNNTRQLFPNMQIPSSMFDNASLNILKFIPGSNDPNLETLVNGENFFFSGASRKNDQDSYDIKVDHIFDQQNSLHVRWSYGDSFTVLPGAFTDLPEFAPSVGGALGSGGAGFLNGLVDNPARSLGIQYIHTFNPTTINEFRAAYVRAGSDAVQLGAGNQFADQLGIPNINVTENNDGFPGIGISGYGRLGDSPFFPLIELENIYQILDNITFIRGSHTIKVGVDAKRVQRGFTQILGDPAGSFSFGTGFTSDPNSPADTGNSFADFMLGIPSRGSIIQNSGLAGLRSQELSGYFQDIWKVTPKFTLNYGVRFEVLTPQHEMYDRQSNFDRGTGLVILPGQGGTHSAFSGRAQARTDAMNIAPRFGMAYKLSDKTVIRASYGIFYLAQGQVGFQLTLNPPFVGGVNYTNTATPQIINRRLSDGLPATDPFIPIDNPFGNLNALDPDNPTGYTQQWMFSLQHQLTPGILFDMTYLGNSAYHLTDLWNPHQAVLGNGPVEPRRPFFSTIPNVTGIRLLENRGNSNYNALQTSLTKRFSRGISFMANYTWGHTIGFSSGPFGNAGHQDNTNLALDYSNAPTDVRHRAVFSWTYEVPFKSDNAFANGVIGNWQIGGVTTLQKGSPYTVSGGAGRPDRICDGRLSNPTVERWFDASCFPLPTPVSDPVFGGVFIPYGNAAPNVLPGPGIANFDLSLFKKFPIGEQRVLEFRIEFFNALNHSQFFNPSSAVNTGTTGRVLNARDSRQIQVVGKFSF